MNSLLSVPFQRSNPLWRLQLLTFFGIILSVVFHSCVPRARSLNNDEISQEARRHLEFLAGDGMQGRDTPSRELDKSAGYIAKEFQSYGLAPVNGSYFQNFKLFRTKLGESNALTINDSAGAHTFLVERDYNVFDMSATASLANAGVVFVGYGIQANEQQWDDYAGIDARDKIVIAIAGEPFSADPAFFDGAQLTRHAYTETKLRAAESHGAAGIIIIGDPRYNPRPDANAPQFSPQHPRPKAIRRSPLRNDDIVALGDFGAIREIFFPNSRFLTNLIAEMAEKRSPHSFAMTQSVSVTVDKSDEALPVRNVMGLLRGTSDDEGFIVVGAHYDHLGVNRAAASPASADTIFNGADDNASGTTGVLVAARILSGKPLRPRKSILFVCFTAEEKGLYGSQAFVQDCLLDIRMCKEMINMDMIGRNHPDSISIGGGTHFPALSGIAKKANAALDQPLYIAENIEKFYLRGDQASFAQAGIPVVFFSSGLHPDYHQPSDELSKINFGKVVRVSHLCAETALTIANITTVR